MNDCVTTTKQSTTKPCAYFLGYTVQTLDEMNANDMCHTISTDWFDFDERQWAGWITSTGISSND